MSPALFPARGFAPARPERPTAPTRLIESKAVPAVHYPPQAYWLSGNPFYDGTISGTASGSGAAGMGIGAYRLVALVYACMRYRATKLVEPPLWITDETKDGETPIKGDSHPLADLLERPNPDMEMADLLELTSLYLDGTGGRALWVKSRDRAGRVAALYPFAGHEFTVEPDQVDGLRRLYGKFRVDTADGVQTYGPDDVVFFRNVDPRNHHGGMGPLDAVLSEIGISESMREAVRALLRNAIRPGSVTEVPGTLGDAEFQRLKLEMAAQYGGAMNQGKNILLEGGAKFNVIDRKLTDLAMAPIQGDVEAAVCQAFQVHPALVGAKIALENSSGLSDSLKPAQVLFYDLFAYPTWARIEKTLTRSLLREVDPDPRHFIRFTKDDVRALEADMTARTTEAENAKGYWTVNERRQHTDQEPFPDDDPRGELLGDPARVGIEAFGEPAEPGLAPGQTAPKPLALVPGQQQRPAANPAAATNARVAVGGAKSAFLAPADAYAAIHDAVTRSHEPYLEMLAAARLAADRDHLAGLVEQIRRGTKAERVPTGSPDDGPPLTPAQLAALDAAVVEYLTQTSAPAWSLALHPPLAVVARGAVERAAASLGVRFDVLEPGLRAFVDEEVAFLVSSVTDTTRDAVRAAIGDGVEAGEGVTKLAARVRDAGGFSKARATLIARTEATRATNGAQLRGMRDVAASTGLTVEKQWYTALDERVRPAHAAQHGVTRPLDGTFPNGRTHPDEPNCRCTLLYSIAGAPTGVDAPKSAPPIAATDAANPAGGVALHVHVTKDGDISAPAAETKSPHPSPPRARVRDVDYKLDAAGQIIGARVTDLYLDPEL